MRHKSVRDESRMLIHFIFFSHLLLLLVHVECRCIVDISNMFTIQCHSAQLAHQHMQCHVLKKKKP